MSAPDNAVQAALDWLETSPNIGPHGEAHIRLLAERLTTAKRERAAAIKSTSDGWRAAGEAQGKLEASELAGVVEGWRERAERAERERDEARALAEERLEAMGALLDEAEDVFVCMADSTGIDRNNLPSPFRRAAALVSAARETEGSDHA